MSLLADNQNSFCSSTLGFSLPAWKYLNSFVFLLARWSIYGKLIYQRDMTAKSLRNLFSDTQQNVERRETKRNSINSIKITLAYRKEREKEMRLVGWEMLSSFWFINLIETSFKLRNEIFRLLFGGETKALVFESFNAFQEVCRHIPIENSSTNMRYEEEKFSHSEMQSNASEHNFNSDFFWNSAFSVLDLDAIHSSFESISL